MKRKILTTAAIVMCALLLVAGSIAGTLAYLTSQATVNNTFTVGDIKITMDEANVDLAPDSTKERDTENAYHLLPGKKYVKDPTIHITADSEDCFLFVKIDNQLANILVADSDAASIATQLTANGWVALPDTTGVYYYNTIVSKTATDKDIEVFGSFTVKSSVVNSALAEYNAKKITVTAYAIQADGLTPNANFADNAVVAWNALSNPPQG